MEQTNIVKTPEQRHNRNLSLCRSENSFSSKVIDELDKHQSSNEDQPNSKNHFPEADCCQQNTHIIDTSMCVHQIIEDLIDITPDHSKYVYYCEKCYECFTSLNPSK
jgi:hypothetical protein